MKYNVMVVLNSSYFNFGKVFINSFHDKVNLKNVDNIFIVDTGLTGDNKKYFSKFDKVYIHNSGLTTDYDDGGSWGNGWQQNVGCKTIVFKSILEQTKIPLIMIDGDCLFVKDFSELIDDNYDIQSCRRESSVPYLASFVVAQNNSKSIKCMDEWIRLINEKPLDVPRESPSLGEAVNLLKDKINIGDIEQIKVSTHNETEFCDDTYVIHLKGSTLSKNISERETKSLIGNKNFSNLIRKYIDV